MASENNSDYELLTEHLGYPPVSLLDDIINTVNVLADRALESVERLLLSIPPQTLGFTSTTFSKQSQQEKEQQQQQQKQTPQETAKLEIESGTHKLETLLTASIDRNFDKLELYTMQNILTVQPRDLRPHMRLSHYSGLDFSFSSPGDNEQDMTTIETVTNLRRRLQASQSLNIALNNEKASNEALLARLKAIMGIGHHNNNTTSPTIVKTEDGQQQKPDTTTTTPATFGFLTEQRAKLSSIGSHTPVTTTTQFALSQLQALRELSSALSSMMPILDKTSTTTTTGDKSWRRERVEYVEGSSRKFLENMSGLELDEQGGVRDGEYQGEGRGLSKGEVEGLEKVVSMFNNS